MSEEISRVFAKCKEEGRAVFLPFITAGFPEPSSTVPLLLAMEQAGADIIELGVPFSDPMADGPTIQYSNTKSLQHNTNFADCLEYVRQARAQGLKAPIVLMGYVNPLIQYGEERAVKEAKEAGANAFIVVDLPLEEEPLFFRACVEHGMSFVPLIAPTTRDERLPLLLKTASSFVYFVSVAGVTGKRAQLSETLPDNVARLRKFTDLPIAVGFGISTREHFVDVEKIADAVVIGSAIIRAADKENPVEEVSAYIRNVTGNRVDSKS